MRGHERFHQEDTEFFKHFKEAKRPQGRIFLVATSAAEVGVNITSEMMLTSLVESDRLLQRLGRLNRFGDKEGEPHAIGYAHIVAIQPKSAERISETDRRRQKTLEYLRTLNKFEDGSVDVSCEALTKLPPPEESGSKVPLIPRLEPWHICLWSQTSAQSRCYSHDHKLVAAMPDLESWLHGQQDDIPETSVAWRAEVEFLVDADPEDRKRALQAYRVLAHEKVTEPTTSFLDKLKDLAPTSGEIRALFQNRDGNVDSAKLSDLAKRQPRELNEGLLLLPPGIGNLYKGMWQKDGEPANDIADQPDQPRQRYLLTNGEDGDTCREIGGSGKEAEPPSPPFLRVELPMDGDASPRRWLLFKVSEEHSATEELDLATHLRDVGLTAARMSAKALDNLEDTYRTAGETHDTGKNHPLWQRAMGGSMERPLAKTASGKRKAKPEQLRGFRHELRSVIDLQNAGTTDDLLLHLVASHHGCARPYWEAKAYDPEKTGPQNKSVALEAIQRFARLQAEWGPWGLAYLEALFKSSDVLSEEYQKDGS
jgi:CRISPR-associated endonuclease/helicase Cas3